jgi:rhamnose utilization protein RhaD (predicted bifunctional aldolase and dehydrogenase)
MNERLAELVALARNLGDPTNDLAILAEGNVSGRLDNGVFLVKASGFSMRPIGPDGFVEVLSSPILAAMDGVTLDDNGVKGLLAASRAHAEVTLMPSVETFMHAYLLELPDVNVIGHTHPTPLVALLSMDGVDEIARQRIFPDEVVCCGPESCYVPYADPGLPLAQAIRAAVEDYARRQGMIPRTIWLQNHGLIALGKTVREVESATYMSAKAARVWLAALASGRTIRPLTNANIARIHTRPDEHYRQKLI